MKKIVFLLAAMTVCVFSVVACCSYRPKSAPPPPPKAEQKEEVSRLPEPDDWMIAPWMCLEFSIHHPEFMAQLYKARDFKNPIKDTPQLESMLKNVNEMGNTEIEWTTDELNWGTEERWEFPKAWADGKLREDCDGIALWKFKKLVDYGVNPTKMWFCVVTLHGEGHALLVVSTDKRDYILDNNHAQPISYQEALDFNYIFRYKCLSGSEISGTWGVFPQ